ncbi:MAG: GNAT family N-acetyltransferase [Woeseia sp.]|nr:GNAT family N-acetyltransferase [Woeseia sp.]MBT8095728.1 GNAT family N-acetyltransferase [Woeseia sp.]NNE62423.1 GNAT family N-acetyltransferase [Woeseia sp.]NNL55364.1 GNAT family N-acetyltransferase [Woeseia sp.]
MSKSNRQTVHAVRSDEDIAACFDCMHELRPTIERTTFVTRVRAMEKEGYRLASIAEDGHIVAVAGFRYMHTLFGGDTLYVDDLITLPAERSRGYGAALIKWLRDEAVRRGCKMLHLDSGIQRARAHRFYFETGFHVNCFHFAQALNDE